MNFFDCQDLGDLPHNCHRYYQPFYCAPPPPSSPLYFDAPRLLTSVSLSLGPLPCTPSPRTQRSFTFFSAPVMSSADVAADVVAAAANAATAAAGAGGAVVDVDPNNNEDDGGDEEETEVLDQTDGEDDDDDDDDVVSMNTDDAAPAAATAAKKKVRQSARRTDAAEAPEASTARKKKSNKKRPSLSSRKKKKNKKAKTAAAAIASGITPVIPAATAATTTTTTTSAHRRHGTFVAVELTPLEIHLQDYCHKSQYSCKIDPDDPTRIQHDNLCRFVSEEEKAASAAALLNMNRRTRRAAVSAAIAAAVAPIPVVRRVSSAATTIAPILPPPTAPPTAPPTVATAAVAPQTTTSSAPAAPRPRTTAATAPSAAAPRVPPYTVIDYGVLMKYCVGVADAVRTEIGLITGIQAVDKEIAALQTRMDALRACMSPQTGVLRVVAADLIDTTSQFAHLGLKRVKLLTELRRAVPDDINSKLAVLHHTNQTHLKLVATQQELQSNSHRMLVVQLGTPPVVYPADETVME